jgi:hypothetical protein
MLMWLQRTQAHHGQALADDKKAQVRKTYVEQDVRRLGDRLCMSLPVVVLRNLS